MTEQVIRTACTRDCPDACSILAHVENQRVTKLTGDPDHPVTAGFLCHRTSRFLDKQYSPQRLTRPLYRASSADTFQEISIDHALDMLAERLRRTVDSHGGQSIFQYRCGGSMGILKLLGDHFFQQLGPVTVKRGDVCTGAGEAAQNLDFGRCDSSSVFDVLHSKTIVVWGKNLHVSSVHMLPILRKAQKKGAKIIVIDPAYTRTGAMADLYIQPAPGGDIALAAGVIQHLMDTGKVDPDAHQYCDHLAEFTAMIRSESLERWAQLADVSLETLVQLAELYADGPSSILVGWGLQRRKFGSSTVRMLDALASVSGNLGVAGGGVSFYYDRRGAFDLSFLESAEPARSIPEPLIGKGLQEADPPIRLAYIWGANPVSMLPDSNRIAEALRACDFTVVVDPFLTDTAAQANLVIPTTTMLEEHDLLGSYGHHYLSQVQPVVDPPEGVLSDYDIFRQLARRLQMSEFDVDIAEWKTRLLGRLKEQGIAEDAISSQKLKNPFSEDVLFRERDFATPSGKVNLINQLPEGYPDHVLCSAGADPAPLRLMACSSQHAQGAQWVEGERNEGAIAVVHPDAAAAFNDGDRVTLRSAKGQMQVQLKTDDRQRRDVVLLKKGGWLQEGNCANALIDATLTDMGEGAVYYDTVISIGPA